MDNHHPRLEENVPKSDDLQEAQSNVPPVNKPVRYFDAFDNVIENVAYEEDVAAATAIQIPINKKPETSICTSATYQRLLPVEPVHVHRWDQVNWSIEKSRPVKDVVTLE